MRWLTPMVCRNSYRRSAALISGAIFLCESSVALCLPGSGLWSARTSLSFKADSLVLSAGPEGPLMGFRTRPLRRGSDGRVLDRPLYEAFSVSMVELSGGPGSTHLRPGQHLGGHRLASLYRAVSVAQRRSAAPCSNTPLCMRPERRRDGGASGRLQAGGRDRGRKSRTATRRSSTLYPVGPDQDPGQDAVYGTGDLNTCERTGPIYKSGVLQPGAATVTRPSRYASQGWHTR
jgi:hypothetical protein